MAARRGADNQQKWPVAPQVLAKIVRLATATEGRLLADPWRLATILHRQGYRVPANVRKALDELAALLRSTGRRLDQMGPWAILLEPTSWPLLCEVIIEAWAALPLGYELGGVELWESGEPTVRQQRARARAIRSVCAELLRVPATSSDEDAAWWKSDYPLPPRMWPAKERTAFTVRQMQFHLVHEATPRKKTPREEMPCDDKRAPDMPPPVVQPRLTLKREREHRQPKGGAARRR